jgi:hypothetical protein
MPPLDWLDPDIAACIEVALLGVIDGFDHDVAVRHGDDALRIRFDVGEEYLYIRYAAYRDGGLATERHETFVGVAWHGIVLRLSEVERELFPC